VNVMCVCVCVPRSRLTTHNRANEIKRTQKYSGFLGLLSLSPSTGLLLHHALIIRVPVRDYVWKTQKSYNCHHRIIIRYTRATCHDIPVKILPFVLIIHSFFFFFFLFNPRILYIRFRNGTAPKRVQLHSYNRACIYP